MTSKPHWSPSSLEMLAKCGEQWRRRYLEGEIIPPGIAAVQGTGVHAGAAANYRQKIDSHIDLPKADIVDAAVEGFKAGVAGGLILTPEEVAVGRDKVLGQATDQVVSLASLHADEVAPAYQPVAVEERIRISLPGPRDMLGVVDLITDGRLVVDHKTAGKAKTQDEADSSFQLTYYAAAHAARFGAVPSELRLEVLVKTQKPKRQVLSTQRDSGDFRALAARIDAANRAVSSGTFVPAPVGAWWCAPKWCGYWASCPFVNRERAQAAQS